MAARRRARDRNRNVAEDSDPEPEDGYGTGHNVGVGAIDNEETLKQIAMRDLGSGIRDFITSVDHRDTRRLNRRAIMEDRACNEPGSEASELVARNRPATNNWNNFGNTMGAKEGAGEDLGDICGGQAHRERTKDMIAAQALAQGREVKLEDTYDDRSRHHGIPPSRFSRGSFRPTANYRGNFSTGRGGGHAGRGPARPAPAQVHAPTVPRQSSTRPAQAPTGNRPLDPAVDPDRPYLYKGKGPQYGAGSSRALPKQSTPTAINNTAGIQALSSVSSAKSMKDNKPRSKVTMPSSRINNSLGDPAGPALADHSEFMAAVSRSIFALGKTPASQAGPSTTASTAPASSQSGLLASEYAAPSAISAPMEKPTPVQRLSREEFRDPDLSPGELTDALPSTGQLSMASPSMQADSVVDDSKPTDGLGISIDGTAIKSLNLNFTSSQSQKGPEIMDVAVPEAHEEIIDPSHVSMSPAEEKVFISKAEAEQWNTIKALLKASDISGLMKHLKFESSAQLARPTAYSATDKVAKDSAINDTEMNDIIGNQNLPRGTSIQTTLSLAQSKWASSPRAATATSLKSLDEALSSTPTTANGQRISSPIAASSSSSSYFTSVQDFNKPAPQAGPFPPPSQSATNPFVFRDTTVAKDEIILDYGDPVKSKPALDGTVSSGAKPVFQFTANTPAQNDDANLREAQNAKVKSILEMRAQAEKERQMKAQSMKQMVLKHEESAAFKLREEAAAAALRLTEEIVMRQKQEAAQKLKSQADSKPAKPTSTSAISTRQSGKTPQGLDSSRWSIASPMNTTSTLRDVSPNKSFLVEKESTAVTASRGAPKRSDSPIFGDTRNVACKPVDHSLSTSSPLRRSNAAKTSRSIKHTAPGPGYALLLREMEEKRQATEKAALAKRAVAQVKTNAQQYGTRHYVDDSSDSEL